jgi:hypothetical protein
VTTETLIPLRLGAPDEPAALRHRAHLAADQQALVDGIAAWLWDAWGDVLQAAGLTRETFGALARGYRSELWLWAMGERPWRHVAEGLAGRVERRLPGTSRERH